MPVAIGLVVRVIGGLAASADGRNCLAGIFHFEQYSSRCYAVGLRSELAHK
jgi:hypothetical protein